MSYQFSEKRKNKMINTESTKIFAVSSTKPKISSKNNVAIRKDSKIANININNEELETVVRLDDEDLAKESYEKEKAENMSIIKKNEGLKICIGDQIQLMHVDSEM